MYAILIIESFEIECINNEKEKKVWHVSSFYIFHVII